MLLLEQVGLAEARLQYCKMVGPTTEGLTLELLTQVGINCQLFAHWVLEELCLLSLPKDYLSSHIWSDQKFMRSVDPASEKDLKVGDILFSYRQAVAYSDQLHLAVMVGRNAKKQAEFLHTVQFLNKTVPSIACWTLSDFATSKFHHHIFGVRRVVSQPPLRRYRSAKLDAPREWIYAWPEQAVLKLLNA